MTFTATLASDATGSITFRDGAMTLGSGNIASGSAAVSNGTATFTTSALIAAGHTITASYSGDANSRGPYPHRPRSF